MSSAFQKRLARFGMVAAGLYCAASGAVQTVPLPAWVCAGTDTIYRGGFEDGEVMVPHDPSQGSGGATGSITRTVHLAGLGSGTQTYYLYVPADYTPARSWPLLLALHGTAPYGEQDTYAANVRKSWSYAAAAERFIVAAPVAHDVFFDSSCNCSGVTWLVPEFAPPASPTDYDQFAAIRADVESAYNIERTRIYGWGFSAGAMVMHDLGVNTYSSAFNASTMAAYAVSAGDLAGLACTSGAECNQALAALPRKIPVDIHIGTSDPNYPYAQSDHTRFLVQGWSDGATVFYTAFSGGHQYTAQQLADIWNNLCPNAVIP